MFKALTPIIGIIVAVGLFFTYVKPTFEEVKKIQDETAEYAKAVEKASELQRRIAELKAQQNSISIANLERLEALLPDRVDEVSVLIDLFALATAHRLTLGDIKVGDSDSSGASGKTAGQRAPTAGPVAVAPAPMPTALATPMGGPGAVAGMPLQMDPGIAPDSQYATLDIGFSVTGTYDDFRSFLADLERSLVLMEVTTIDFEESEGDATEFSVTVRLYSLTPPTS